MKPAVVILLLLLACAAFSQDYVDRSTPDSIRISIFERNPLLRQGRAESALRYYLKQSAISYLETIGIPSNPIIDLGDIPLTIYPGTRSDEMVITANREVIVTTLKKQALPKIEKLKSQLEQAKENRDRPSIAMNAYLQALEQATTIYFGQSDVADSLLQSVTDFFDRVTISRPQSIVLPEGETLDAGLRIYYRAENGDILPMNGIAFMVNGVRVESDGNGYVSLPEEASIEYRLLLDDSYQALIRDTSGELTVSRISNAKADFVAEGEFPPAIRDYFRKMGIQTAKSADSRTHLVRLELVRKEQRKMERFDGYVAVVRAILVLADPNGNALKQWTTDDVEAFSAVSIDDAASKAESEAMRLLIEQLR